MENLKDPYGDSDLIKRVVIFGSRTVTNQSFVHAKLDIIFPESSWKGIDAILDGNCRGPDTFGGNWGKQNGIRVEDFPADWDKYGKRAGFVRNHDMALSCTHAVGFFDGKSKGTKGMIEECVKMGRWVKVIYVT